MQVERIEDMQVGDFTQLPNGEWHKNHAAKASYAAAQQFATASEQEVKPQFQINSYSEDKKFNNRLERIR